MNPRRIEWKERHNVLNPMSIAAAATRYNPSTTHTRESNVPGLVGYALANSCIHGKHANISQQSITANVIIFFGPNLLQIAGKIIIRMNPAVRPNAPNTRPTVCGKRFKPPEEIGMGRKTVRIAMLDIASRAIHA